LGEQEPVDAVPSLRRKASPHCFGAALLWAILAACGPSAEPTRSQDDSALSALPEIVQRIHFTPPQGAAQQAADAGTQVTYHGGAVISNVEVVGVLYGAGSYMPEVVSTAGRSMSSFYQDVLNSPYVDWLDDEYNTVSPTGTRTNQHIGRGTFKGLFSITPSAANSGATISVGQAMLEIVSQVKSGNLPRPSVDNKGYRNTYYAIFFPPEKTLQGQCTTFCAAHSYIGVSEGGSVSEYYIGFHPDLRRACPANGCGGGSTFFDYFAVGAAHELLETITDPGLQGWFSDNVGVIHGEIADFCGGGKILVSDGGIYNVSKTWSNSAQRCQVTRPQDSDFTLSLDGGVISVLRGQSELIPFSTSLTRGGSEPLAMSVRGAPAGLVADSFSPYLEYGDTGVFWLTAAANSPLGLYELTLLAAGSSGLTRTAVFQVEVLGANDWSLTITPPVVTVLPGHPATLTIYGTVTKYGAEPVTLSPDITGLPPGLTATISPTSFTPGVSWATLTLAGGDTGTAGPVSFTVRGTSSSQPGGHTATAQVQVDTLPTVAWVSPASGTTVGGTVRLSITAVPGANTQVRRIDFTVDGVTLASGTASSVTWDTTALSDGPHTVRARVTDADNGVAETSVTLTVSNAPVNDWSLTTSPSVATVLPGLPATLTISGAVSRGVAEPVTLVPDISGLPAGVTASFSPTSFTPGVSSSTLTLTGGGTPTLGPVSITVRATSASQPEGHSATTQVQVDTLPTVTWVSPASGSSVSGTVRLSVAAAPGANTAVRAIAFSVDGVTLASGTASSLNWDTTWDTTRVSNGAHTVRAQVTDADNGAAETSATLIVSNSPQTTGTGGGGGGGAAKSGCSSAGTGGGVTWLGVVVLTALCRRTRRSASDGAT
jgi:Big-like domain-containing protein